MFTRVLTYIKTFELNCTTGEQRNEGLAPGNQHHKINENKTKIIPRTGKGGAIALVSSQGYSSFEACEFREMLLLNAIRRSRFNFVVKE
uniref:Uncharacterized protein n=1 Tax=Romanomermis culicivorax TaxID=13658 RepID=A0A915IK92_ROMCU